MRLGSSRHYFLILRWPPPGSQAGKALVRYFGRRDLAELRQSHGDNVFFNWFGDRMITYRKSWVLPLRFLPRSPSFHSTNQLMWNALFQGVS